MVCLGDAPYQADKTLCPCCGDGDTDAQEGNAPRQRAETES
jgi:hypothetical protein